LISRGLYWQTDQAIIDADKHGMATIWTADFKRRKPVKYDKRRYKRRNRIEIMFGRLKDWRRVATRYDRCPKVFLSAIALAAAILFWL